MAKFVLKKSKLMKQYELLEPLCDIVSYSAKTNRVVAKILKETTNCQFSLHSLEDMGDLPPDRLWFFAQGWSQDEVEKIVKKGIFRFVLDNESDLKILLDHLKNSDLKTELLLRMRLKEHTVHTGRYFVYGMYSSQINDWIPKLKNNKNISKIGIHFHRKSQNISEWSLKFELAEALTEETLRATDYCNIGGGIPVNYKNFSRDVTESIFTSIRELKEWLSEKGVEMIIEPGRFLAAPPITLHANIVNIYDRTIILDCSVYNTAMDTFIVHHKLLIRNESENNEKYTVKGCTPDSMDIFRYKAGLENLKVGDEIVFLNAGAYNYTSDFCNLPKLETEVVE